jgi:hypothetical protein
MAGGFFFDDIRFSAACGFASLYMIWSTLLLLGYCYSIGSWSLNSLIWLKCLIEHFCLSWILGYPVSLHQFVYLFSYKSCRFASHWPWVPRDNVNLKCR